MIILQLASSANEKGKKIIMFFESEIIILESQHNR